jgi:hypothetical protein
VLEQTTNGSRGGKPRGLDHPEGVGQRLGRRLNDEGLIESLRGMPIKPGSLSFELVESIFLDEHDDLMSWNVESIKDLGIDIEIDDFGTGYASIVSLLKLKPKRLKIDRQFIMPIVRSPAQRQLVGSIIEIGKSLGIEVWPKAWRRWSMPASSSSSAARRFRAMPSPGRCRRRPRRIRAVAALAQGLLTGRGDSGSMRLVRAWIDAPHPRRSRAASQQREGVVRKGPPDLDTEGVGGGAVKHDLDLAEERCARRRRRERLQAKDPRAAGRQHVLDIAAGDQDRRIAVRDVDAE